ncbi:hypothetical protein BDQ12DRAFT_665951 [Crucibulum laeve]|uniref:Uncharacterized protein n=1 Tax=Crucibulum laeve TaxID=68775 RepID=A0A5C3M0I2_9AGAR|nr:hypothetical protein BDQ12DRAFT_665951 [Crucibulum laeve]
MPPALTWLHLIHPLLLQQFPLSLLRMNEIIWVLTVDDNGHDIKLTDANIIDGAKWHLRPEIMAAILKMIRKEFGGTEAYMKVYSNLSEADISAIKQTLLM